jgi:hypothetical protein
MGEGLLCQPRNRGEAGVADDVAVGSEDVVFRRAEDPITAHYHGASWRGVGTDEAFPKLSSGVSRVLEDLPRFRPIYPRVVSAPFSSSAFNAPLCRNAVSCARRAFVVLNRQTRRLK